MPYGMRLITENDGQQGQYPAVLFMGVIMQNKYYYSNGYINMAKIIEMPYPFIFVMHGRGTGKTYGACEYLLQHDQKFMLLRRTQVEADTIGYTDFSPFQPVLEDHPEIDPIVVNALPNVKNIHGVWKGVISPDTGKLLPKDDPIGYVAALSTFSNIRGFNGEQIKIVVFDEFIPEPKSRTIKNEDLCFLNFVETVGRNRELKGQPPLKIVCLSNANKLASPIFQALGIMEKVDKLAMSGKQECLLHDRGIAILKLADSPISKKKQNTALYRAAANTEFSDMALSNAFDMSNWLYVKTEPINEYRIVAQYEDVYIYRHKTQKWYYVCKHKTGSPKNIYVNETFSRKRLRKEQMQFYECWIHGAISFQDYYCKAVMWESLDT